MKTSEPEPSGVYVTVATRCSSGWKVPMTTRATVSPLFPLLTYFLHDITFQRLLSKTRTVYNTFKTQQRPTHVAHVGIELIWQRRVKKANAGMCAMYPRRCIQS